MHQESRPASPVSRAIPKDLAEKLGMTGTALKCAAWLAEHDSLTEENLVTVELAVKDLLRSLFILRAGQRVSPHVLLYKRPREASPSIPTPAEPVCPAIKSAEEARA